ncbi:MAG TPA: VRR-NUC domain-containing protein, partial [Dongiaceae bacterium]|nr:VRR-NUC domain-containing protein [Dongiaceae bacterium]
MLNNCGPSGSPPNTGATMMGLGQTSTNVLDAQMELLCMIFCQCLQTRPFAKQGTNVGVDRTVFETPEQIQAKTNRFDNQQCVARELEGNPTLIAEQRFDMRRSPPAPITQRLRGHRRPDVVCLAKPGAASGLNITRIVEMKFPGDSWNQGQQDAYERIAQENNPDAEVKMIDGENEPCICEKS